MLVMSRKNNQEIFVGSQIKIMVCGVSGGIVKIGISAPDSFKILRGEHINGKLYEMAR